MKIKCPACQAVLSIPADAAGKVVKCPCGKQLRAPDAPANTGQAETPNPSVPAQEWDRPRRAGGTFDDLSDPSPNPFTEQQPYSPPSNGDDNSTGPYPGPRVRSGQVHPVAIVSLVLGIMSLTMGCCCWLHIPLGIGAAITGGFGISMAKQGSGGKGMAIAGLVMGIIALIIYTILAIVGIALNVQNGGFNNF